MKKSLLIFLVASLSILSSCKKDNFNAVEQAAKDEQLIKDYITANKLTATRHESGVYYIISSPGNGSVTYTGSTNITAKYAGRYLKDGVQFDNGGGQAITFPLGGVILGWQIGVPLIQKGGKIRLLVPSAYAYGHSGNGPIGPDEVLDFDIELVNVQ